MFLLDLMFRHFCTCYTLLFFIAASQFLNIWNTHAHLNIMEISGESLCAELM